MALKPLCGAIGVLGFEPTTGDFSTTAGAGIHNSKKGVRVGWQTIHVMNPVDSSNATTGLSNNFAGPQLDNATEGYVKYVIGVPSDFEPGKVKLRLWWSTSEATVTRKAVLQIKFSSRGEGDGLTQQTSTIKILTYDTASDINVDDVEIDTSKIRLDEIISIEVRRLVDHALDDVAQTVDLHGMEIRYLRRG